MKKRLFRFPVLPFLLVAFFTAQAAPANTKGVESFSNYDVGTFPKFFKTWPMQRGDAKQVYLVKEEGGNKYLAAFDDKNLSEQIFREFHWKIDLFPHLKWRWRARTLPKGAAENNGAANDSACGIYVLFGRASGTALKFTWSTTLPQGTVFVKKPGEMVMKILDSGPGNLNKWRTHSLHIPALYKELFKRDLTKEPTGIGILTDANATQSTAACDYDDFLISAKP